MKSSEGFVIQEKPKSHSGDSRAKLAEKMGVSERKAQQLLNVMESAPELPEGRPKRVLTPLPQAAVRSAPDFGSGGRREIACSENRILSSGTILSGDSAKHDLSLPAVRP
jgi:hypothetical protein